MTQTITAHSHELQSHVAEVALLEALTSDTEESVRIAATERLRVFVPSHPLLNIATAHSLYFKNEHTQARRLIEETHQQLGEHVQGYILLGIISEDEGYMHEAEQFFLSAITRFPEEPAGHRFLAVHYNHRQFYGESAVHAFTYLKKVGASGIDTLMAIDSIQQLDGHSIDMLEALYALILGVSHLDKTTVFHATASVNQSIQYEMLHATMREDSDETLYAKLDECLSNMLEHGLFAAVYDDSEEKIYRHVFQEMCRDMTIRHAGWRAYPDYIRLRFLYFKQLLLRD